MTVLSPRVQRIVPGEAPVLHLEPAIPGGEWPLRIDGAVEQPLDVEPLELRSWDTITRRIDLHCVWGWSQPGQLWEGVHFNAIARRARPLAGAKYVLVSARESPYASCFTLREMRDGVFAWRLNGRQLAPDRGWPLRFVPPAYKWAYKSVKWVERITFLEHFQAGMWEERVGDPVGDVPWDVLQRFEGQAERYRASRARGYDRR